MSYTYEKRWAGLGALCVAMSIITLDNTVLDVALPSISNDLKASMSELQWIVDIYILFFASILITIGALGDQFGRKRFLKIGIVLFSLASLGAGLSTSTIELILFRSLSGFGAAFIMPSTLSIITHMFTDPDERMKAIGLWSMIFGLSQGLGPLIGGFIIEYTSWHWVFFINLPIGVIAFVYASWVLPESHNKSAKADLVGMVLCVIFLFALTYGIIEAGVKSWSDPAVHISLSIGLIVCALFILLERRCSYAMIPFELFEKRTFTIPSFAIALIVFGMVGSMFFFSQLFQTVEGYNAFEAGLLLMPMTLGVAIGAKFSSNGVKRYGAPLIIGGGIIISALGMAIFVVTMDVHMPLWSILVGFLVQGLGMGFAMPPSTDSIMGSIPKAKAGVGSALNDTTIELSAAMSIAILGSYVNRIYLLHVKEIEADPTLLKALQTSIQAAHQAITALPDVSLHENLLNLVDHAFIDGMYHTMILGCILSVLSGILTLWLLPKNA
ncbi:MFS transporter [Sulfurospirillum multivorans]|uniref:DHA2 family protein n=2 Tax=Sulfurospirillum multivorans TaxID=66821 RepID=A0AA86AQK4_SULMK|nr:MFS transporter [Sulfurospirillum multivorans]AHJ13858.1 DHA2 family protein [Sulfurospirillum multivorans DSM 12446]QEH07348.1 DHA2 family protein [Sulfurospirillum multivorans]